MESADAKTPDPHPAMEPVTAPLIVQAYEVFQGRREIIIEHEGVRYRLRITRRNKLILQK